MIFINSKDKKIVDAILSHQKGLLSILKRRVTNCNDINIRSFLSEENLSMLLTGNLNEFINLNNVL